MHISSSYSSYGMYNAEARNRMLYLNPGTNYTPWLFIDGTSSGSGYTGWQGMILSRASVSSPASARMWGNYNPATGTGEIFVRFCSDTTAELNGNVLFVITEDSIMRATPNGDLWHNHVARDYIPDQIGTPVSLRQQDSVTVSYPFTINSGWVANRCEIIAIFQSQTLVGSTREIWQGAKKLVSELPVSSIEENPIAQPHNYKISVNPNPCINQARFTFTLPAGNNYRINFFDAAGRTVKSFTGTASGNTESVHCDLSNSVNAGIYFYRFESSAGTAYGKLIVK